jgi:hypothetical protein
VCLVGVDPATLAAKAAAEAAGAPADLPTQDAAGAAGN